MTFNTMETWRMETWQMQTLWPLRQDVNRCLTTTTAGDEKETSRVLGLWTVHFEPGDEALSTTNGTNLSRLRNVMWDCNSRCTRTQG